MGVSAMTDFPRSLIEFQRRFPDERACAEYLARVRWPDGFRCPCCGQGKGWELSRKAFTWDCASCRRQTSVTAGTVMHASKLPLTVWFWAAYLMATTPTASPPCSCRDSGDWDRTSRPGCSPPSCAGRWSPRDVPCWPAWWRSTRQRSPCVQGRTARRARAQPPGKMLVAGAVEVHDGGPGRVRLGAIADASAESLHAFVRANVEAGATARSDGWSGYPGAPGVTHEPHVVGPMAAHLVLPWTHRVFAHLKCWALGVYHGLRRKHLQSYLDEFAFRFNRRHTRHAAFRSLLAIGVARKPTTYKMLIIPEPTA